MKAHPECALAQRELAVSGLGDPVNFVDPTGFQTDAQLVGCDADPDCSVGADGVVEIIVRGKRPGDPPGNGGGGDGRSKHRWPRINWSKVGLPGFVRSIGRALGFGGGPSTPRIGAPGSPSQSFGVSETIDAARSVARGVSSGVVTSLSPGGGMHEAATGTEVAESVFGQRAGEGAPYYLAKGATEAVIAAYQFVSGVRAVLGGLELAVAGLPGSGGASVPAGAAVSAGGVALAAQAYSTSVAANKDVSQGLGLVFNKGTTTGEGTTSPNQLNQAIKRGQAPPGIKRVDVGKVKGEQIHVHFDDGAALNIDGTWKHGKTTLTKAQLNWLGAHGWTLPIH